MMYKEIGEWLADCRAWPRQAYDDIQLYTGDEGRWKSKKIRLIMRALDPTFEVDRIHFNQNDFLDQAVTLPPGSAIALDEFRGHKRLAMHGDRMEWLDFAKECRDLRLHICIAYPHVQQVDKDILFSRIRYWCHSPVRGRLKVYERISGEERLEDGKPTIPVKFVLRGIFPFTKEMPDPLFEAYVAKKEARMRDREARFKEAHGKSMPSAGPAANPRLNLRGAMLLADLGQQALKQGP